MKSIQKVGFILAATFCFVMTSATAQAQVFSQNFNSSAVLADYVHATTPNTGQFNAITVAGAASVSINTGTLEFVRPGSDAGTFSRTTDLLIPAPTALIYKFDVSVPSSSAAQTSAAFFQIGSGFGTTNAAETSTNTYAQFSINFTATSGTFQIRNTTTSTNSGDFTGTQTITWALNNSGSTLSYLAPDATTETVANDTVDIWIGTTKAFNDVAVTTATQSLADLKFAFTSGNGTIRIDNIQIDAPLIDSLFYRSAASGNWNSAATWESSSDNVNFVAATHPPSSDSNSITILSPHTVTVTAATPVDQVVVDSGGQITVNSGVILTVANGSGTDLSVSGTLLLNGSSGNLGVVTLAASAATQFNSGGKYQHNFTDAAGTIPTATWDQNSTVEIIGYTSNTTATGGISQSFGNFTWNCPSQTGNINLTGGLTTVNGTFTMATTNTAELRLTGATALTLSIGGNYSQTGGTLVLGNSTADPIVNLLGDFSMSGGSLSMSASATTNSTLNVFGNFSHTSGTITETSTGDGVIIFKKSGTQIYTSGGTVSNTINFTVNSGTTLNMGTSVITGGGNFTLSSGATLGIGSIDGITSSGPNGNIQNTGARNFNSGANYTYNGSAPQLTGNGLPATVNNLTISNSTGVSLSSGPTVSGTLFLTSGALSLGANTLTLNGAIDSSGGGTLTGGATSNITFGGSGASTTLPAVSGGLNNLTISRANGITLGGPVSVGGTLTLTNGVFTNGANLAMGNGATISRDNGSLSSAPSFGSAINVLYTGTAGVTTGNEIPTSTSVLNNLTISKSGGVTLGANTTVNGILALNFDLTTTDSFVLTQKGTSSGTADVIGTVERDDVASGLVAFGNPNVQINNGSSMTLQVRLVKETATGFTPASVARVYTLDIISGSVSSATLRLHYLNSELGPNTGSLLHLYRADGDPSATWQDQGAPSSSATASDPANWIQNTGVAGFSSWTLADGGLAPTAVKLTRFNAASFNDGVALSWESGYEVNNLGYHLYREQNGKRTRVTPAVVAGSALKVGPGQRLTAGYSYSWFDPQGTPDASYSLEAIDLNGTREVSGSIYPARGAGESPLGARKRALLLKEVANGPANFSSSHAPAKTTDRPATMNEGVASSATRNMSVAGTSLANSSQMKAQQAIAAGRAVKIAVSRSGWYRVTQAELLAAGLDPISDARRLQLIADAEELPIRVSTQQAQLGPNDSIEFYGQALDTPTTGTRVYWLVNGTSPGKRLNGKRPVVTVGGGGLWTNGFRTDGSFAMITERKDKLVYFAGLLNGEGENIFGPPVTTDPLTQGLTVRNLNPESPIRAQLSVQLQGLTAGGHVVEVQLNGNSLGTISFTGLSHPVQTFPVNRAQLREGENTITLTSTNGEADVSLVDTVGLTYGHAYRADNDKLRFSASTGEPILVGGFTSPNIRVIDVTNPSTPTELVVVIGAQGTGYAFRLQAMGPGPRTFVAFTDELAEQAQVTANQPSTLSSTRSADLLIVTHRDFRAAIEPLAAQRRSEGLQVAVVDIEDVYDEFSFGAHTPEALRDFIGWVGTHWQRAPHYLLLAGDSSWDPRNYLEQGAGDFVPTKLIDTAYMETASDDWLADFNGDGAADIAVGRLPGRTATDVSRMVAKILQYEQERQLGAPLRGALMVADTGFEANSQATSGLLPAGLAVQSLNRSQVGSDDVMRGQIVNGIDSGPMIVNYYGHGSVTVWTGAGLLDSELAATLTNENRPSLFVMMTCLNGYAHDAYIDSLAESLLKSEHGGAMAVWASSGFTEPGPQFAMNQQFYQQLFSGGGGMRLGDAVKAAKTATANSDVRRTWMLLGDPTMRMR